MTTPPPRRIIPVIFAVSIAYAIVRYNLCKGVPWAHLPMYVFNKAIAMTSLGLLGVASISRVAATRRHAGLAATAFSGLHAILSLALLSPAYYAKFYAANPGTDGYSLAGELTLLVGSLGLVLLPVLAWPKAEEIALRWGQNLPRMVRLIILLVSLHCLFYGWSGWFKPDTWPCGLPPITLVSFLFAAGVLVVGTIRRPER